MAGSPGTVDQRVLAACLESGGVATCCTAASVHGLDGFAVGPVPDVLVTRARYDYRWPIARIHTTTWLPPEDIVLVGAIPTLGVARTLFSMAALVPAELTYERVRGAVDDAVRAGLAHDPWLWWTLERLRCRGRNGVSVFEAILATRAEGEVTESWLERETIRVLVGAGLPTPICQQRVRRKGAFVARVDFCYPDVRLVIEVSGYRWHRTRAQMESDLRRRRELTLAGYRVLEYSYDDVVTRPGRLIAEVSEAIGLPLAA